MQLHIALIALFTVSEPVFVSASNIRAGRNAEESSTQSIDYGSNYFVRKAMKDDWDGDSEKSRDEEDFVENYSNHTSFANYANVNDTGIPTMQPTTVPNLLPTYSPTNKFFLPQTRISTLEFTDGGDVWERGSTSVTSATGTITFKIPDTTNIGDTVFLFLSRTDNVLPLKISGWERGAECFKKTNRQDDCFRAVDCVERDGPYCLKFRRGDLVGDGRDLATVMFYRIVTEDDPCEWTVELPGRTTSWAIVTAIPNVNQEEPILSTAETACDISWDAVFPTVYGEKDDVLLLSQSFDDRAERTDFRKPRGTELLDWTNSRDEAGFLYGKLLESTGMTGEIVSRGPGGPKCKDALLSVVVNRFD
mmetsp:Transcript_23860/g.48239  ORF Transcript_23860/g.48239 Transcript_23860/m.48239 type:complete len:363 (-) Transcript_23860:144-1232(-)